MYGLLRNKRSIRALLGLGIFFLLLLQSSHLLDLSGRRFDAWPWTPCPDASLCTAPRALLAKDVQVVVKTGASEPSSRLRYQLETVLSEVPLDNILIFSDMEDRVGRYRVHDAYAGMSMLERASYPIFALYDAQQELRRQGKDVREAKNGWLQGGWDLAKYMNLAMMREIWRMQQLPGNENLASRKWFVFVDTDTYIEWDNLLELLSHLDANGEHYLGSPVWLPALQFAHGGSAYVLSAGAMKALNEPVDQMTPFQSQYGLNTTAPCCGDEALARVLKAKGIRLEGYWPMFNGEAPATVTFGRDTWCEPVVSLHHVSGREMEEFWRWTMEWKSRTKNARPLLFEDLFSYVEPWIIDVRTDWENMHDSTRIIPSGKAPLSSAANCSQACEADKRCLQYAYDGATCALSHHVRLGKERMPEEDGLRDFTSGWMVERIVAWTSMHRWKGAHWVRSNP